MATNPKQRLGVLIDADNAQASVIQELLTEASRYGTATSSNTPLTSQTWQCTCPFRLQPKRRMKATAPMCSTAWFAPMRPRRLLVSLIL